MKTYDWIAIGTGSAMNVVEAVLGQDPDAKIAVVDKDEPGGICLTRGCIPTKLLIGAADTVRLIEEAPSRGVRAAVEKIDFAAVMNRMRKSIGTDIAQIRTGLSQSPNVDYFNGTAAFTAPYTLRVKGEDITSRKILLCTGSRPLVPSIPGLDPADCYTSDTILGMERLPLRLLIVGGGYIAAEYGHFFSAMGAEVTVAGRNPRFLPQEEPEIGLLAKRLYGRHMTIHTGCEITAVEGRKGEPKTVAFRCTGDGSEGSLTVDAILLAAGRGANTDILDPQKGGIDVDARGWIKVNEYLETSRPGVWAFGDAVGRHLFKHAANYESQIVYYNAVQGRKIGVDYHAVPRAVFGYPEIAAVGMQQEDAVERFGEEGVLVGFCRYQDTARGEALGVTDGFCKVLVEAETRRILGAHLIGPHASILIQEIVTLMYTPQQTVTPILAGMHIHPALSEVVERAVLGMMPLEHYNRMVAAWSD